MDIDYNAILNFFKSFGWELGILALSGIFILGFLKLCGVFKNINPNNKKYIYFGISCLFSLLSCTIFLLCTNSFNFTNYLILCAGVISLTITVYGIYEHTGLRTLWNKLLKFSGKLFKAIYNGIINKTITNDKAKEIAIKLGVETLQEIIEEANKKPTEPAGETTGITDTTKIEIIAENDNKNTVA